MVLPGNLGHYVHCQAWLCRAAARGRMCMQGWCRGVCKCRLSATLARAESSMPPTAVSAFASSAASLRQLRLGANSERHRRHRHRMLVMSLTQLINWSAWKSADGSYPLLIHS